MDSLYIHTSLGSLAVGAKAIPRADPNAVWRRNMAMTNDLEIN